MTTTLKNNNGDRNSQGRHLRHTLDRLAVVLVRIGVVEVVAMLFVSSRAGGKSPC